LGKFSNNENACYLENAYENYYTQTNPILAARCLSELSWLHSIKIEEYLINLNIENSIAAKLSLLMYWETNCNDEEMELLLTDKKLVNFITPHSESLANKEIILKRLSHFENYIFKISNENRKQILSLKEFEAIAKNYFETYNA
jgi:hypothetical protein